MGTLLPPGKYHWSICVAAAMLPIATINVWTSFRPTYGECSPIGLKTDCYWLLLARRTTTTSPNQSPNTQDHHFQLEQQQQQQHHHTGSNVVRSIFSVADDTPKNNIEKSLQQQRYQNQTPSSGRETNRRDGVVCRCSLEGETVALTLPTPSTTYKCPSTCAEASNDSQNMLLTGSYKVWHLACEFLLRRRQRCIAYSAPGTPCVKNLSLGVRRRLGQDATNTQQQGR